MKSIVHARKLLPGLSVEVLQPPEWPRPKGYSNGVSAQGRTVFVSGMVGWDANGKFTATDLVSQVRQALHNIVAVLSEADAKAEHIVRMTWYIVDKAEYLASGQEIGAAYREVIGRHYPAMTVVQVVALLEDQARVEIEATAVVPESD